MSQVTKEEVVDTLESIAQLLEFKGENVFKIRAYQNAARLSSRINSYVNKVAGFNGYTWGGITIKPTDITGRALNLGIPKGGGTPLQYSVIEAAQSRAKNLGVNLIVTPF